MNPLNPLLENKLVNALRAILRDGGPAATGAGYEALAEYDAARGIKESEPDPLDIAYLALGAKAALAANGGRVPTDTEGELNYIEQVIAHEATINRVFREIERGEGGYGGVFAYDVAEEFGRRYGAALLRGEKPDADALARELIEADMIC